MLETSTAPHWCCSRTNSKHNFDGLSGITFLLQ